MFRSDMQPPLSEDSGPRVVAVCTSPGGIPKLPQPLAVVRREGLVGDGHNHAKHCRPDRAVSLWDLELLQQLASEGFALVPGAAGENLTVVGLHVQTLPSGTLLEIGGVLLRLEQPRKPCYVLDAIDPQLKEAIAGRCGYLASVMREGVIAPGMQVHVVGGPATDKPEVESGQALATSRTLPG